MVLGIDGMDPKLLQTFVDQGRLPNFKALMAEGDFRPLQTTMPPQSPVAWSTFMTGMDPGGHGIFDFIHVDQSRMAPYSSMAQTEPGRRPINIGSGRFQTSGGGVRMLRKGDVLANARRTGCAQPFFGCRSTFRRSRLLAEHFQEWARRISSVRSHSFFLLPTIAETGRRSFPAVRSTVSVRSNRV
jgi:hypothetical protein